MYMAYSCTICGKLSDEAATLFKTGIWICPECAKRIKKLIYPETTNGLGGQGGTFDKDINATNKTGEKSCPPNTPCPMDGFQSDCEYLWTDKCPYN